MKSNLRLPICLSPENYLRYLRNPWLVTTTGHEYDIFVVAAGTPVDTERDRTQLVFSTTSRTELRNYRWSEDKVEILIGDGPVGFYMTYYGTKEGSVIRKYGDVVLKIEERSTNSN